MSSTLATPTVDRRPPAPARTPSGAPGVVPNGAREDAPGDDRRAAGTPGAGRLPAWLPGAGHALLRAVTGALFMQHGVQKLFGLLVDPSRPWNGAPPPFSQMWVAGVLELVGGLLIVLGLFTRPVAFLLAGQMAVAYFTAHAARSFWPVLNGGEHTVLFCFVFLYLAAAGAGPRPPADATPVFDRTARASVPTETPGRYIAQLCKHFAHRVPAEYHPPSFEATRGRIEFPGRGACTLAAAPGALELAVAAGDDATLRELEDVVARHLVRFAWREPPALTWR